MQLLTAMLFGILPLATTIPITIRAGAGGPIPKPIPSTCTVLNPLPQTQTSTTNGYKPTTNLQSLWESYFDSPRPAAELWEQCSQQCYGYGYEGDCKSAVLAYNVPVPEGYYGGPGGELAIACILFKEWLTPDDFEGAEEGTWSGEWAGSIHCGT